MSLEVRDLDVFAGQTPLLSGVSLDVPADGAARVLTGPNGVGKTTLARLCWGEGTVPRNRIRLNGRDVAGLPPGRLAKLGLGTARQVPRILSPFSVRENIAIGDGRGWGALWSGGRRDSSRSRAERLAEAFGLSPTASASGLSTGQRRAVEICRCLLPVQSNMLILDEPTANLDDRRRDRLREMLMRLLAGQDVISPYGRRDPVAIMLIEHRSEHLDLPEEAIDLTEFKIEQEV